MRIIYIATSCVSFHSYLCTCIAFPLSHINNPSLVNQSVKLLTVGPRIFSHHFLSSAWRRTSLVEWLPLSSSELQCCWRGQTGRWAGSPSVAAGPYRPTLSPEGPAKVQCLQHWVTVAGVAKLSDQIAIGGRTDQDWWRTCDDIHAHIICVISAINVSEKESKPLLDICSGFIIIFSCLLYMPAKSTIKWWHKHIT